MKTVITVVTRSAAETIEFAKRLGKLVRAGDIICYRGGLGVGKTTFTRGLAIGMGLDDDVFSPTFTLVNEYTSRGKTSLIHFDMYRISGGRDLETTGFYDYDNGENVLTVEWSENIAEELDRDVITVKLVRIDDNTREISVEGDERLAVLGDRNVG